MNKPILVVISILSFGISQAQNTRTSIASGLATNPLIWDCTCFPLPGDSIIINHNVTLNNDFGYSSGAIVINASGSLIGDTPMRAFATSGTGRIENHGIFDVARVALAGGMAHNTGTFNADSLYTNVVFEGGLTTTGNMNISTSFLNQGNYWISTSSVVIVQNNFFHGDTIVASTPTMICDGVMRANLDFANGDTIRGSGQICIYGNSANFGIIAGTIDMCDITSGLPVDVNFGTIVLSVQSCVAPCNIGINETENISLEVYPNPVTDFVQFNSEQEIDVMVFDMLGQLVYQSTSTNQIQTILTLEWTPGVYTYHAISSDGMLSGKLIKQ